MMSNDFKKLLEKISITIKDMVVFFMLLVLILFVFALLGVDLFGDNIKVDKND